VCTVSRPSLRIRVRTLDRGLRLASLAPSSRLSRVLGGVPEARRQSEFANSPAPHFASKRADIGRYWALNTTRQNDSDKGNQLNAALADTIERRLLIVRRAHRWRRRCGREAAATYRARCADLVPHPCTNARVRGPCCCRVPAHDVRSVHLVCTRQTHRLCGQRQRHILVDFSCGRWGPRSPDLHRVKVVLFRLS
jgi:hypothetical protein